MNHDTSSATVRVLLAATLWGTTGTAAAFAPGVGSLAIGAAAMGIGGLLQGVLASRALLLHRHELASQWRTLTVSGAAVAVYPLAFYSSMRLAGVAVGTVVSIGSGPLAAAVIERVIDHQPLSRRWIIAATLSTIGITALGVSRTGEADPTGTANRSLMGVGLGLLAGATYALYSWGAGRTMRRGLPARPVMGAAFGLGGILLLPVLLVTGAPILTEPRNLAALAYLALMPMFLGYVLFGRGLAAIPATTATTLSLLEPAVATIIAVIVLDEQLTSVGWLGMAILLAGLAVLGVTDRTTRPALTTP